MSTPTTHDTNEARFLAPETRQRACRTRETIRQREDAVVERAARIMEARAKYGERNAIDSPAASQKLLQMRLSHLEHEEFHCMWLDAQHRLIAVDSMFRGTLAQTSVYPREVVKASRADELLTAALKSALGLVDLRVLDQVIVTVANTYSFAEHGKI